MGWRHRHALMCFLTRAPAVVAPVPIVPVVVVPVSRCVAVVAVTVQRVHNASRQEQGRSEGGDEQRSHQASPTIHCINVRLLLYGDARSFLLCKEAVIGEVGPK